MWKPLNKLIIQVGLIVGTALLLSGCDIAVLMPKGVIAEQQKDLIVYTVWLMSIIVVPVLIAIVWVAFRYRSTNDEASYTPDWEHSTLLEVICWGASIVIIIFLAIVTWTSSHELDPYKPLKGEHKIIQVVALDWKWLFIYPEEGIATVNDLRFPVDQPVKFKITAQAPMNSFWIPHLGGQVYAMEGMETLLHLQASENGVYPGMSSNFSGRGYNGMKFDTTVTSQEDFDTWVRSVKSSSKKLDKATYDELAKQSEDHQVELYSSVGDNLYLNIIGSYMDMKVGGSMNHAGHKMEDNGSGGHSRQKMEQGTSSAAAIDTPDKDQLIADAQVVSAEAPCCTKVDCPGK